MAGESQSSLLSGSLLSASELEDVNVWFVLSRGNTPETCSSALLVAFEQCEDQSYKPEWIEEENIKNLPALSKKDVFVFDEFSGSVFDYVSAAHQKCVVIGPLCLSYCLLHKTSIPEYNYPLHNMAMYKVVVTTTGLQEEMKRKVKKLVEFMSGVYSKDFSMRVTHLIAATVQSEKYRVAKEKEVPVMKCSWVEAVWDMMGGNTNSKSSSNGATEILATDQKFLTHACPVFLNQVISVSQLTKKDRISIQKLIIENGGQYSPTLDRNVQLLVLLTPQGDKYKAAKEWGSILCVTPDYVYDCVQAGYALKPDDYQCKNRGSSTPTKGNSKSALPDVSMCSTIAGNDTINPGMNSHIDDTTHGDTTLHTFNPNVAKSSSPVTNEKITDGVRALDEISLSALPNAVLALDGCKVYLSGWAEGGASLGGARAEKLRKLLNIGGATRFNQLTEAATHVILGSFQGETLSTVRSYTDKPHLVSALWLIESMRQKKVVDETEYECVQTQTEEKQGNNNSCERSGPNDTTISFTSGDSDKHNSDLMPPPHSSSNHSEEDKSLNDSTIASSQSTELIIFTNLSFLISGYEPNILCELEENLVKLGALVYSPVTYSPSQTVDYCLLTMDGKGVVTPKAKHYISHVYIEECSEEEKVLPVAYYHMPIVFSRTNLPLEGVVLAISSYVGKERQFLETLSVKLGAYFQDVFARKNNEAKGVRGCSHLLCATNSGDKYNASVKWKIPALTRHWLMACLRENRRLPPDLYVPGAPESVEEDSCTILTGLIEEHISTLPQEEDMDDSSNTIMSTPPQKTFGRKTDTRTLFTTPGKPLTPSAIRTPDAQALSKLYPTPKQKDLIDSIATPKTPYGSTWEDNPSNRTRKEIKYMLMNLPENKYEKMTKFQQIEKEECAKHYRMMTDNAVQQLSYDEVELKENRENLPLANCVVYVAKKLDHVRTELWNKVRILGGQVRKLNTVEVTHLIFEGNKDESYSCNRDYKMAREARQFIVHSEWVDACCQQNEQADEFKYPYYYNSNMNSTARSETSYSSKMNRSVEEYDNVESDDDISFPKPKVVKLKTFVEDTVDENSQLQRELAELEKLASDTETQGGESQEMVTAGASLLQKRKSLGGLTSEQMTMGTMDVLDGSQNTNIGWSDPVDSASRKRLENISEMTDDATENPSEMTEARRHFVLAQLNAEETEQYTAIVQSLGGVVQESVTEETTHVITNKAARTEKILTAIAMGKWVLCPQYLVESSEEGCFVEESAFEFGSPANTLPITYDNNQEKALSNAAHRWRCKGGEPFSDWHVLLFASKSKSKLLSRVLRAGGATVMTEVEALLSLGSRKTCCCHDVQLSHCPNKDSNDSFVFDKSHRRVSNSSFPEEATLCLVDTDYRAKFDFALFAAKKVPCLDPLFMFDCITSDPPPDPWQKCIAEYKQIYKSLR